MHRIKILLLFLLIGVITYTFLIRTQETKTEEDCKNPTKIEDYTDRDKAYRICESTVMYGDIIVANKEDYPDLFGYLFNNKEVWDVKQEVVVYKIEENEFIAIFPVVNPYTWYMRSGYIFQKMDGEYKLVFSKPFKDLQGRWTGVRFDENGSIFDSNAIAVNQDFGEMGYAGQRISWRDYYTWDSSKNTYVLANNKMTFRLNEMRKYYEDTDLEACGNESSVMEGKRISELYSTRRAYEHFCDDSSPHPYISKNQVEMFLKAKKALDEIAEGKNYSFSEIKKISLE